MEDTIVPMFIVLIVFGAPVTAFIVFRVLAYKERVEMIRHGFTPPPDPRMMRKTMKYGAKYGWTPGMPPTPGAAPPPGWVAPGYDPEYYAQHQLRKGIQVAFIGLALLIGLSFIGNHGGGQYSYGPWLLGGLIPMFVGIAQIITALLSGARIGGMNDSAGVAAGSMHFGPPEGANVTPPHASTPSGNMPPPPTPGSYGAWRPGGTPEIEKPAGPPDRI
jgi:hypothetical protein